MNDDRHRKARRAPPSRTGRRLGPGDLSKTVLNPGTT